LSELISSLGSIEIGATELNVEGLEQHIRSQVEAHALDPGQDRDMATWVQDYFADLVHISDLLRSLRSCSTASELCNYVFQELQERSPTAVALTLKLLRRNKGRDLQEVFRTDLRAADFMLSHPDFLEGVRARVIDKDQQPRWQPPSIDDLEGLTHGDVMLDKR
ncbi:MAG: enoyl-CoA hydratase/isomerase family protein, partial [Desulfohalobiaceae bacterium]